MSSYHKIRKFSKILSWTTRSEIDTISPETEEPAESEEIDVVDFAVEVRIHLLFKTLCAASGQLFLKQSSIEVFLRLILFNTVC